MVFSCERSESVVELGVLEGSKMQSMAELMRISAWGLLSISFRRAILNLWIADNAWGVSVLFAGDTCNATGALPSPGSSDLVD